MLKVVWIIVLTLFAYPLKPYSCYADPRVGQSGAAESSVGKQTYITELTWSGRRLACQILPNGKVKLGMLGRKDATKFSPLKPTVRSLRMAAKKTPRLRARLRRLQQMARAARAACLQAEIPGDTGSSSSADSSEQRSTSSSSPILPTPTPVNPDSDADGLPDNWEFLYFSNLAQGALNDPDQDWRMNFEELAAGSNPTVTDGPLANPGFEEGVGEGGRPLGWTKFSSDGGTQQLDSTNPHGGSFSWKLTRIPNPQGNYGHYIAWSDPIPVDAQKRYIIRGYVRTETGNEKIYLGWEEYSNPEGTESVYLSHFLAYDLPMPAQWTLLTGVPRSPQAGSASVRIRFYVHSSGLEPCSAWFDDFSVVEIGSSQLPSQGCSESAISRCLDFGADNEHGEGYSAGAMGEALRDGETTYRELLPLSVLDLQLPSLSVNADGFPLHPLRLEIRYKDTIDSLLYARSSYRSNHRAWVHSRLDFRNLDPAYERPSQYHYEIGSFGDKNDQQWKYWQFDFAKSQYQLIRAIDGKFLIRIKMPNLGPLDAELRVPIDYISLREISEADHQALIQRERLYSGYYEIGLPKDEPEILPDYPDPRLVTYSRDPMRPIFSDTKPNADELTDQLTERTAAGEIVTLAAGLYSPEGIGHLRFEISALINSQTQDTISAANVEPFEVRLKDARLDYADTRRFATIPDHLAALSSLHIPAQSSRSIWFKIHVPLSASGSYAGEVVIKSQDEFVGRFKIILHVVPQLLDQSSHLNPVWLDPWLSDGRIADESLDELMRVYRETGFDSLLWSSVQAIKQGGEIIGWDSSRLERLIDRSVRDDNGYGSRRFVLWISGLPAVVHSAVYGSSLSCSNPYLYDQLSTTAYRTAFQSAISKYLEVAAQKNVTVQFFLNDEPTTNPCSRIVSDRLYPLIQQLGGETSCTYTASTDVPLEIDPQDYIVPGQQLPGLTAFVDHKVWNLSSSGQGFQLFQQGQGHYPYFGFYTTGAATLRNPIYNRFMHGIFPVRTGASSVQAYAMTTYNVDPHNDFDIMPSAIGNWAYPDFLFAYPTWNHGLLPTLAMEGIRLGIQDAKYFATLKRLIAETPTAPAAIEAQQYLDGLFTRVRTDLYNQYFMANPRGRDGPYRHFLRDLSEASEPEDFEAFSRIRSQVLDYIDGLGSL